MKLKFVIGFFLCFGALHAQVPYYVNASFYGEKEGIVVPERIGYVTEDNNGLIWIGSENGLYSFNGTQFKNYRHSVKDNNSLPGNNVTFNYQDRQHIYWVYILGKGLYNFDPKTEKFLQYRYKNEKEFNIQLSYLYQVFMPFEDSKNRLWLPAAGYGIVEIDRKNNVIVPHKICFPGNCDGYRSVSWVTRIFEDRQGQFWLATNGGLVLFDPQTDNAELIRDRGSFLKTSSGKTESTVNYFGPQVKDDLWIGTWGEGIKKFNTVTRTFETFLWNTKRYDGTNNICTGIYFKDSAHLWISTYEKELYIFDLSTHKFQVVKQLGHENYSFTAKQSCRTADGNLWLGMSVSTLVRIDNTNAFSSYAFENPNSAQPAIFAASCFIKMNNKLYIGAEFGKGVYQYDPESQTYREFIPPGQKMINTSFFIAAEDRRGFFAGGEYGLLFFNTEKQKFESIATDSITGKKLRTEFYCAAKGKDGSIWLGGLMDKLFRFFPQTGKILEYSIHSENYDKDREDRVTAIATGNDDNVWFAHNPLGLGCLQVQDGKVVYFNESRNKGYPANFLSRSLCKGADGSIFFTVLTEGLWQLKNPFTVKESCINYNMTNGLPSDYIRCVFRDNKNNLWLSSTNGISYFDPQTCTSKNFSEADGLKNRNLEYPLYQDSDGLIYIGQEQDFQTFHPDSLIKENGLPIKLIINAFKVNNADWPENINYLDKLVLEPGQNNIQFQYAGITHGNSLQLKYAYMLEGFDKTWIEAGNATTGNYNNLPPGDYTLKIKAGNQFSSVLPKIFTLPVIMEAYWYNTVWFKGLMVLMAFGLLYAFYRYRIYTLRKETALKFDFDKKAAEMEMRALRAQMNPHFIFNCLTSINRYIVKSDNKTASNYLTKFAKLIRLILDNSAADYVSLDTEIQTLQLYMDMEALRFDHAFEYEIQTNDAVASESISIPSMLVQPYAENAIWHGLLHLPDSNSNGAAKGKLCIRFLKENEDILRVEVEDNGVGRKKAKEIESKDTLKKKSYGMQISKDRIELINKLYKYNTAVKIIDLEDDQGASAGTQVLLHIPLVRNDFGHA